MRRSIQAAVVVAGAFGFLFMLALGASADIVNTSDPSQSQPQRFMPRFQPASAQAAPDAQPASSPQAPPSQPPINTGETPAEAPPDLTPAPAPAPEHIVTRSVAPVHKSEAKKLVDPFRPVAQAVEIVQGSIQHVGAFFGEVASACKVGVAGGSGGPALVFAVLGMATALERRRVFGTRWATDEEVPEMLYAWDVIAPG